MMHLPAGQEDNPGDNNGGGSNSNQATTYKVTFSVKNATNQNLSNVVVTLTDTTDNTNVKSGTSDNGVAEITGVKPGTYSVTATRDGYTAETIANVTVTNADVTVTDAIVMNSN
jgi:hypothetical protein